MYIIEANNFPESLGLNSSMNASNNYNHAKRSFKNRADRVFFPGVSREILKM